MEELPGEGINRERRVKSTRRERTSARHICFCAGKKWPHVCVFSHYLIRSLRQRRYLAERLCSPQNSIHGNINSSPAPYLHGEFLFYFFLHFFKKRLFCLCSVTLAAVWNLHVAQSLDAPPRLAPSHQLSYYRDCKEALALSVVHLHGRSQPPSPLTNWLRQSSRHDVWKQTDCLANL